jgi:hypothetical protein
VDSVLRSLASSMIDMLVSNERTGMTERKLCDRGPRGDYHVRDGRLAGGTNPTLRVLELASFC